MDKQGTSIVLLILMVLFSSLLYLGDDSKAGDKAINDKYEVYYEIVTSSMNNIGEYKVVYARNFPKHTVVYDREYVGNNIQISRFVYCTYIDKDSGITVHIYDKDIKIYPVIVKKEK